MENLIKILSREDVKKVCFARDPQSHKGHFGTVGLLGGSINYSGAIKLSSLAAMRSGAGIARVVVDREIVFAVAPELYENTLFPYSSLEELSQALEGLKALAVGMGWGISDKNKDILSYILSNYDMPIVIDADGINILASNLHLLKNTKCKVVLTPHLKEFSCLTGLHIETIERNKIDIVRQFSKEYNCIVLLKGHETIVSDGRNLAIINNGVVGMATAGSGDVLSGIIVGMLGYSRQSLFDTVNAAAFVNGVAGELSQNTFGSIGMTARDTANNVAFAIKSILEY